MTRNEIANRVWEVLREVPETRENYASFIKKKAAAIAKRQTVDNLSDLKDINWSQIPPAQRMELARRVARLYSKDDYSSKPPRKPIEPNKKRSKRKTTTEIVEPNKHPQSQKVIQPPSPANVLAKVFPEEQTKHAFSSRVGYFVSVSDVHYYTEEPISFDEPRIEFDFEEEGGHLTLSEGTEWYSQWYEGSIIRGMDINISGTHSLNYVRNSSFEL